MKRLFPTESNTVLEDKRDDQIAGILDRLGVLEQDISNTQNTLDDYVEGQRESIISNTVNACTLNACTGKIDTIDSETGSFTDLQTTNLTAEVCITAPSISADTISATSCITGQCASVRCVNAINAGIYDITSTYIHNNTGTIDTFNLNAEHGCFKDLTVQDLQYNNLSADEVEVGTANVDEVNTNTALIGCATIDTGNVTNVEVDYADIGYITHKHVLQSVDEVADTGDYYIVLPTYTNGTFYLEARNDGNKKLWSVEVENGLKNVTVRWSELKFGYLLNTKVAKDANGLAVIQIWANTLTEHATLYEQSQSTDNTIPPTIYSYDTLPDEKPIITFTDVNGTYIADAVFTNKLHIDCLEMEALFMDCVGVYKELWLTCKWEEVSGVRRCIADCGTLKQYISKENINGIETPTWTTPADTVTTDCDFLIPTDVVARYDGSYLAETGEYTESYEPAEWEYNIEYRYRGNIYNPDIWPVDDEGHSIPSPTMYIKVDDDYEQVDYYYEGVYYGENGHTDTKAYFKQLYEIPIGTFYATYQDTYHEVAWKMDGHYWDVYGNELGNAVYKLLRVPIRDVNYPIVHLGDDTCVHGDITVQCSETICGNAEVCCDLKVDGDFESRHIGDETSIANGLQIHDYSVTNTRYVPDEDRLLLAPKTPFRYVCNEEWNQELPVPYDDDPNYTLAGYTYVTGQNGCLDTYKCLIVCYEIPECMYDWYVSTEYNPSATDINKYCKVCDMMNDHRIQYLLMQYCNGYPGWCYGFYLGMAPRDEYGKFNTNKSGYYGQPMGYCSELYDVTASVALNRKHTDPDTRAVREDELAAYNCDCCWSTYTDEDDVVHSVDTCLLRYNETSNTIEPTDEAKLKDLEVENLHVTKCACIDCDVVIGHDLYVKGTTHTVDEETMSTSGDVIILRQNAPAGLATGEASGIVVRNGNTNVAIVTDCTGTIRTGEVVGTNTTYPVIYFYDDKYYSDETLETEVSTTGDLTAWDSKTVIKDDDNRVIQKYINAVFTVFNYECISPVLSRDEVNKMTDNALLVWNCATLEANTISIPTTDKAVLKYRLPHQEVCGYECKWYFCIPRTYTCCGFGICPGIYCYCNNRNFGCNYYFPTLVRVTDLDFCGVACCEQVHMNPFYNCEPTSDFIFDVCVYSGRGCHITSGVIGGIRAYECCDPTKAAGVYVACIDPDTGVTGYECHKEILPFDINDCTYRCSYRHFGWEFGTVYQTPVYAYRQTYPFCMEKYYIENDDQYKVLLCLPLYCEAPGSYYWERDAGNYHFTTMASYEAVCDDIPNDSYVTIDEVCNYTVSEDK